MADRSKAVEAAIALLVVGGVWLYITGRLDPLIRAYEQTKMPQNEAIFARAISSASDDWADANDIQREGMPSSRARYLCSMPKQAQDWFGKVTELGTYLFATDPQTGLIAHQQPASLNIQVGDNVTLQTEGDAQDYGTKIERDTTLFDEVSRLRVGQSIVFSGSFVADSHGCPQETSLTNSGSMTSPNFVFRFSEVKPPQ